MLSYWSAIWIFISYGFSLWQSGRESGTDQLHIQMASHESYTYLSSLDLHSFFSLLAVSFAYLTLGPFEPFMPWTLTISKVKSSSDPPS